jgi:hypothetical protein
MADVNTIAPTELGWRKFETRHRTLMRDKGIDSFSMDYAVERFRPIYDELQREEITVQFTLECKAAVDELRSHHSRVLDKLAHATMMAFAEVRKARRH